MVSILIDLHGIFWKNFHNFFEVGTYVHNLREIVYNFLKSFYKSFENLRSRAKNFHNISIGFFKYSVSLKILQY